MNIRPPCCHQCETAMTQRSCKFFLGKYFILWDIVDPRSESNPNRNPNLEPKPNPNPNPNPEPNPKPNPNPNPNPNPDPTCGFTISHKMKYLRFILRRIFVRS